MITELQEKGWYLTQEGIEACKEGIDKATVSSIIRKALDTDLREIGSSFLSEEVYKNKVESISGPCVLQVQKIKNVSVPKYETSNNGPALYRMHVTDGITTVSCLQWGAWKSIHLDTPPGTKLLFKANNIPVVNGFLVLKESHFTVLGGNVPALVEKWELKKSLATHVRRGDTADDGPPPWIPFGKSIKYKDSKAPNDFKSLEQEAKEQKEDNALFKQQRQANIAEVSKAKEGKVKVFGGGKEKPHNTNYKSEENTSEKPYKNSQGSFRRGQPLLETPNSAPVSSRPNNNNFSTSKYEKDGYQNHNFNTSKYEKEGYQNHFNASKYEKDGNQNHFGAPKYEKDGNQSHFNASKYEKDGNQSHFNASKYEKDGNQSHFNASKYDKDAYQNHNFNVPKYEKDGYQSHNFNTTKYEKDGYQNQPYKSDTYKRNDKDRFKKYDARNNMDESQKNYSNNPAYTPSAYDNRSNSQNYTIMKNDGERTSYRNNVNRMEETMQSFAQMNLQTNSSYAGNQKSHFSTNNVHLKPGTDVLARYWEDKRFYHAKVHAVGENGTCVVYFVEYGNYEEVRISDIRPVSPNWNPQPDVSYQQGPASNYHMQQQPQPDRSHFSGVLEFRRGGNKPFVHRTAGEDPNRTRDRPPRTEQRPSARLYQVPHQRQPQ